MLALRPSAPCEPDSPEKGIEFIPWRLKQTQSTNRATAGLDNPNNRCMMYFSSLSLGYYKLLRILLDSYQVLDDPGSN
jgi:hypothetical protein